jgi:hypothetical protein
MHQINKTLGFHKKGKEEDAQAFCLRTLADRTGVCKLVYDTVLHDRNTKWRKKISETTTELPV